jgi:hypothetical protein
MSRSSLILLDFIRQSIIHSFIHSPMALQPSLLGPGLFFSFVIIFTQTVGPLGRVISPSQGRYLHTRQHKHRIDANTDIHALSGIRTNDPSVRASEGSSCLRLRGHRDRPLIWSPWWYLVKSTSSESSRCLLFPSSCYFPSLRSRY